MYFVESESMIASGDWRKLPSAKIAGVSLQDTLGSVNWSFNQCMAGPGGQPGTTMCPSLSSHSARLGGRQASGIYRPETQTWHPAEGEDGKAIYWIGVENNDLPRPVDLMREKQVGGNEVVIDEHSWTIPIIRPDDFCTLDKRFKIASGVCGFEPIYSSDTIRDLSKRFWEYIIRTSTDNDEEDKPTNGHVRWAEPSWDEGWRYSTALLGINYLLGAVESTNVLGLLKVSTFMEVIRASLAFPQLIEEMEARQKNCIATGTQ